MEKVPEAVTHSIRESQQILANLVVPNMLLWKNVGIIMVLAYLSAESPAECLLLGVAYQMSKEWNRSYHGTGLFIALM